MAETERNILVEILGFDPETGERLEEFSKEDRRRLVNVSEDGNPQEQYPSWESIVSKHSPWWVYLADPYEVAIEKISEGKKISRRRRNWVRSQNRKREIYRDYIKKADQVIVFSSLSQRSLAPSEMVVVESSDFQSAICISLGQIVSAFRPSKEDILKLANNSVWGTNGGFRLLSNIIGKPVTVRVAGGREISQVYYPEFADRRLYS